MALRELGLQGQHVLIDLGEIGQVLEILVRTAFTIAGPRDDLAFGVHQEHRGKAFDIVLLGKLLVLVLQVVGLFLLARIIEFHEDELLGGPDFEGLLVEDFMPQPDAPTAPVRAGEVDQQILLFLQGLGLGRFEVGLPKTFGGEASGVNAPRAIAAQSAAAVTDSGNRTDFISLPLIE